MFGPICHHHRQIAGRLDHGLLLTLSSCLSPTALSTGIASGVMGKLGFFQPFILFSGVFATIGVGLIYTFDLNVGLGPIIGYQILYGVGCGLGVQTPNLVATVTSSASDVSTAVSTVSCECSQRA